MFYLPQILKLFYGKEESYWSPFLCPKNNSCIGLQLVHSKLCKNVTGSTGLHYTSSRSDHTHLNIHEYFSDDKRGGSDLT